MISVGSGIFIWEPSNTLAKRGTTKFSSTKMEASPTVASRAG